MTYDHQPVAPRSPLKVAGDLVLRENDPLANEAARLIRDLNEHEEALRRLLRTEMDMHDTWRKRAAEIRSKLEAIICTEGEDAGTVLLVMDLYRLVQDAPA